MKTKVEAKNIIDCALINQSSVIQKDIEKAKENIDNAPEHMKKYILNYINNLEQCNKLINELYDKSEEIINSLDLETEIKYNHLPSNFNVNKYNKPSELIKYYHRIIDNQTIF